MRSLFLIIVLLGLTGCRGYRHSICVSVDSPIFPQITNGEHSTLKVEYRFEENRENPKTQ